MRISDLSSDVCSSDLIAGGEQEVSAKRARVSRNIDGNFVMPTSGLHEGLDLHRRSCYIDVQFCNHGALCKPALFIIFAIIGDKTLGNYAQNAAPGNHHCAIVKPACPMQGRAT